MKLIFATWNEGKLNEVRKHISPEIELIWKSVDLDEFQTDDLLAISKDKAKQAFELVKAPVVVDDTAIYFNAYKNFPGVFAKYMYKSLWASWFQRLFHNLEDTSGRFETVLSYMDETLEEPLSFVGRAEWKFDFNKISDDNHYSLPYNYIFIPNEMTTSVAEDYDTWLDNYSHRMKATLELNKYLTGKL